ncbi:hypothetical protein PybrP1_009097 [[Pythium] brassicae (nom. inval.)]|nr:hypothetical protein PybrP1_009097 [[Pythium] brassicae (nom. inval.)]
MGNTALATTCFCGQQPLADLPSFANGCERALVVDIDAPALALASARTRLKIRAASFQLLAQLPLHALKQLLLAHIRKLNSDELQAEESDCLTRDSDASSDAGFESVQMLTVDAAAREGLSAFWVSIATTMGETTTERRVLLQFEERESLPPVKRKRQTAAKSSSELCSALQLKICARCGVGTGCGCGWRDTHSISPREEQQSLAQVAGAKLPTDLSATVLKKKVVHPAIERPYAVYTVEVRHGEMSWQVTRRFNDFAALHARLADAAPSAVLPELPRTKWLCALDDDFLLERQLELNDYLKSVLFVHSVNASVPLLSFLGALTLQRRDVLHLRVLNYYVAPGDLVLFRCCGPVSGIQRSMTGSEWDHVGVVVPGHSPTSFYLLEATGEGVSAFPLVSATSRLIAYSAFHVKYVALRKLHTPLITLSARFDLLRRFAFEVEGNPYGLSVAKLLRAAATSEMTASTPSWRVTVQRWSRRSSSIVGS